MLRENIFKKVVGIKCCDDSFPPKKLQAINVAMNSFEWKQNEHKILAFVVCFGSAKKIKKLISGGTSIRNLKV